MACKRSGVRISVAPLILNTRSSKQFFKHIPGLLAEAFWALRGTEPGPGSCIPAGQRHEWDPGTYGCPARKKSQSSFLIPAGQGTADRGWLPNWLPSGRRSGRGRRGQRTGERRSASAVSGEPSALGAGPQLLCGARPRPACRRGSLRGRAWRRTMRPSPGRAAAPPEAPRLPAARSHAVHITVSVCPPSSYGQPGSY